MKSFLYVIGRYLQGLFLFFKCNKKQVILFALFSFVIYFCGNLYRIFNKIPNREVFFVLSEYGSINTAFCKIDINMDYGGQTNDDADIMTQIEIWEKSSLGTEPLFPKKNRDHIFDFGNKGTYLVLSRLFNDSLNNIYSMISLKFMYYSNVKDLKASNTPPCVSSDGSMSYMSLPTLRGDGKKHYIGSEGYILFTNIPHGQGTFSFSNAVDNGLQKFWLPWDISQTNFKFKFNSCLIECKKLKFEFYGPTEFSTMYPEPDKITASSIEFTDTEKMHIIMADGLYFHADFLNCKNLLDVRNLLITSIMSIAIAFLCNIIWKYIE